MEQEVYRVKDFCERYAMSRRSFYREIKANRLRVMKRGHRTYITRSDAQVWLESQRQASGLPKAKASAPSTSVPHECS